LGYGGLDLRGNSSWHLVHWARDYFGWNWLDHFGQTKWGKQTAFVSEPYTIDRAMIDNIDDFCRLADVEWRLLADSWHFPGRTVRIVIFQKGPGE
jgi:hypothetical protein